MIPFSRPVAASLIAARHSLRLRLSLLISALLVAVVAIFLWTAHRELDATLVRGGNDRARAAADQVASLLARSTQAMTERLRAVALDSSVQDYLRNPTDQGGEAVRARLASLGTGGERRSELWTATGSRLLVVATKAQPGADAAPLPPEATWPLAAGYGPLQAVGNVVFTQSAAEVSAAPSPEGQAGTSARLGYVVVRSTLSVNPSGALGRIVGGDAVVAIGNAAGDTWSDLSTLVPRPPVDVARNGAAEYRGTNGESRLGAAAVVRGTPWAVWVEFPRSAVVAPARVFLNRMIALALIVVLVGAVVVARLTAGIIRPLQELALAADQFAAGDYSRRIAAPRSDEIGRVSGAFNAMAEQVRMAIDGLLSSQQTIAATLASIHDGVAVVDATGALIYLNPMAERILGTGMLGTLPAEWTVRHGFCLPDGSTPVPAEMRPLVRALTGEDVRDVELFVRNPNLPDGLQMNVNAGPLRGHDGVSTGAWVNFRDVSMKRRLDDERVRASDHEQRGREAQQANRLKSEFLANMSHELRTPLNAIIGFTALMHKGIAGPVSPEQHEYLGDVLTSSRHLLQLINDVLDLAKVESGKINLRPEPIDLTQVTHEVCEVVRELAANKKLRLETWIAPDVPAAVLDPARVKQILYNFLSNAIKFTPEGGLVTVRIVAEAADYVRIDVTDTGPGIDAGDLGRLFVEFQQLDTTPSKRHQGTGLGLALTRRLVEAHGGHVSVQSTVGAGSTFSAILPRILVMAPHGDFVPVIAALTGDPTILVIDNDPATLKLADTVLREAGYRPVVSTSAERALVAAVTNPPAVVIVDLLMPGMDGFEFIERFRSTPAGRDVPVVVWTVKDLEADERRRLESWMVTIVSKRSGGSDALVEQLRRMFSRMPGANAGRAA